MKKVLMILVACTIFAHTSAQTAYEQPKILDNTYVGINAGVNTPLSFDNVFPLNTAINIRAGKDLTPVIGFFIEGGLMFNGNTDDGQDYSGTAVSNVSVSLGNTINFSNLIGGYAPRKFEVMSVLSLGWAHLYDADNHNELVAKTGIDFAFNLGSEGQYQVFIEPAINWNLTPYKYKNAVQFDKDNAYLQISVGFNYKFKCSNGTYGFKTYDIDTMNFEINSLRERLDACENKAPERVTIVRTEMKDSIITIGVPIGVTTIYFAEGNANLTKTAMITLDNLVDNNTEYIVKGYASETGSEAFNAKLSAKRANNVADYLRDKGCKIRSISSYGNTSDPIARVVTITSEIKK